METLREDFFKTNFVQNTYYFLSFVKGNNKDWLEHLHRSYSERRRFEEFVKDVPLHLKI